MLTDYHVHLRPDEAGTDADRFFTAANAERYRTVAAERGIAELGVSEHVYRFTAALDVWQHPMWRENAVDDLDAYCDFVRSETDLRLGIEADFIPGREDRMANLPDGDLRRFYERAMDGIAESRIAVEVSTAGLRKPVGELYPDPAFLEMCVEAGCPVALSSDAHTPDQLGAGYERALEMLEELGVRELSVFERRERRAEPIGAT